MHLYSQASTAWTQASYGHWVPGVGGTGIISLMIAEARRLGEVYSVLTWKNGGAAGFWSRAGFRHMHWGWARWTRDQIADRAQSYRPFVATCLCESRSSPCGNSFSFQIIFVSMDRVMRFSFYEQHAGWEKSCPTRTEMRQMGRS